MAEPKPAGAVDVAALRRAHWSFASIARPGDANTYVCVLCNEPYPCRTTRALAELTHCRARAERAERLEAENADLRRALHRLVDTIEEIANGPKTRRLAVKLRAALAADAPGVPLRHPVIVTLCGSVRFQETFAAANERETLAGKIVLSVGCTGISGCRGHTDAEKVALDDLHKRKIDLSDEILVLNVGGYVGDSTRSEIAYARAHGKRVRWLESTAGDAPGRGEG